MPLSAGPTRHLSRRSRPRWMSALACVAAAAVGAAVWATAIPSSAETPTGWVEVARDGYSRSVANSWGSAELGGSYTLTGTNSGVGVAGSVAYVKLASGRTFKKTCLQISQEILNRYVAYNPFPECIMCGRFEEIYQGDDPVIYKQLSVATLPGAERFKGLEWEPDGAVIFG